MGSFVALEFIELFFPMPSKFFFSGYLCLNMKGPAETKKADSSQIGEVLHLTSSSRHSRNP